MNPNDIARLMNESAGFEIEDWYTDKYFADDVPGARFVIELINRVKTYDLNAMYLDGDSFAKFGASPATTPAMPGLDDTDEFQRDESVAGVLVIYKGVAGEEDLIAAMIEIFKQDHPDDWLESLRWH